MRVADTAAGHSFRSRNTSTYARSSDVFGGGPLSGKTLPPLNGGITSVNVILGGTRAVPAPARPAASQSLPPHFNTNANSHKNKRFDQEACYEFLPSYLKGCTMDTI